MKLVNTITGSALSVDDELGAQLLADGGYEAVAGSTRKPAAKKAAAKPASTTDENGAANDGSDTGSGAAADAG